MTRNAPATSNVPWARIAAEGLAIVFSILLAFAIDALWDARKERAEEEAVLNSLLVDFEDNQSRIRHVIEVHQRYMGAAIELLAMVNSPTTTIRAQHPDSLLRYVFVEVVSLNVSNGALEALLASGRLDIVRNEELRGMLAAWPSWVEESAEDEQWIFRDVQERLSPYLNARIQARNVFASDSTWGQDIPWLPAPNYAVLWQDPVFDNLVTYRLYDERAAIDETRKLEEQTAKVIGLLRAELGR